MLYQVTVTDRFGCSESLDFALTVGTEEDIQTLDFVNLYPNPTSDIATLSLGFVQETQVRVDLFNTMGQRVRTLANQSIRESDLVIDLSDEPIGVYFLRIWAGQQFFAKQLVKADR